MEAVFNPYGEEIKLEKVDDFFKAHGAEKIIYVSQFANGIYAAFEEDIQENNEVFSCRRDSLNYKTQYSEKLSKTYEGHTVYLIMLSGDYLV